MASRGPRNLPRLDEVRIDPAMLAFTLGVSLLAGILFGLAPAIRLSRIGSAFNQRSSNAGSKASRIRSGLVIAEVALSVMLLSGAGLLIHSFLRVQAVDPGFRPERVLTLRVSSSGRRKANAAFYGEVLERVHSLSGVKASGIVEDVLQRRNPDFQIAIAGRATQPAEPISGDGVSPGYFDAIGVRLLKGRTFSSWDTAGSAKVAIINETMARHLWPAGDAIGKEFRDADAQSSDPWYTIVGIVSDMRREGLEREPIAQIFWSHLQRPVGTMDLVVRAVSDPMRLVSAVLDESLAPRRFQSLLLGLLSAIALGLAAVGIYGVMHYSVALRTNEIGIRMALGARPVRVVGMVMRQGLALTGFGLAIGLTGALSMTRIFSSLLFGVTPADPATFALVPALITVVAALACCIPAWRAARIDPLSALRYE